MARNDLILLIDNRMYSCTMNIYTRRDTEIKDSGVRLRAIKKKVLGSRIVVTASVCEARVDPSALALSLSSHRHLHISLLFSFRFID